MIESEIEVPTHTTDFFALVRGMARPNFRHRILPLLSLCLVIAFCHGVLARTTMHDSAGSDFRDCSDCPEMVVLPTGSFTMGSPDGVGDASEHRQHQVTIGYRLAVGKFDVTFAQWDACVEEGGCNGYRPDDQGWGRDNRPVINVNWDDAQAYVQWLSRKTGKHYRLLSESEWEYAARAGTTSAYYWGDEIGSGHANCRDCGRQKDLERTLPVGSFPPNAFGLYDMAGNVWQWTQDCYADSDNYGYSRGAPSDGSASRVGNCDEHTLRGGSWQNFPYKLRSAYRGALSTGYRSNGGGFRVARIF
jgi:formylglycine-generating enzyme required for sulfatase activity